MEPTTGPVAAEAAAPAEAAVTAEATPALAEAPAPVLATEAAPGCQKAQRETAAGDYVILWGGYTQVFGVTLQHGAITNNRYGSFHHDDLVGQPYGGKVRPRKGGAWVALLRPSPELLTQSLVHRTQIIYHADISLILTLLDARPGKVIIEAGTGSGSLSSSFVRALRPGGRLHTFEFHEERQRQAAADFQRYGFEDVVVSRHGNVCSDGFAGVPDGGADGVFLDLPMPWQAIPHADRCLAEGGKVCTFSPCIEQIEKTAVELRREDRYLDIRVFESLAVNWGVKEEAAPKKRRVGNGGGEEAAAAPEAEAGAGATGAADCGGAGAKGARPTSWLSYQMPMRSHTSYILVATRAPADEPEVASVS